MDSVISGSLLGMGVWNGENRKRGYVKRGFRSLALTLFVIAVLIAFYLFFVSSRLRVVRLGYRVSQALGQQKELIEVNRKLRIERATLTSPDRIYRYANQNLGMREPQEEQIQVVP